VLLIISDLRFSISDCFWDLESVKNLKILNLQSEIFLKVPSQCYSVATEVAIV
jgi:hypothetical protein